MGPGAVLWRAGVFAGLWCILAEGSIDSWGAGAITTVLAVLASFAVLPAGTIRFSPVGLILFLAYFMGQSFQAGVRVALLALRPRLAIRPGMQEVRLRLPEGVGRVILINTLNLLPGTLVLNLRADDLHLHLLDMRGSIEGEVRAVETRIAKMLGLGLGRS